MDTQQQKSYKILLIGDSCIDKFHYGICNRISPEAPVPILKHQKTIETGGMVVNVKNNLDAFSPSVKTDIVTNEESITKERFVDSVSGQHLMRFDSGENIEIKPFNMNSVFIKRLASYDEIVISDYNKGFITEPVAKEICELALLYDIPVFVDSKKTDLSCFSGAFVKINEKEYNSLLKPFPVHRTIITKGREGATWDKEDYHTDSVDVVDVSGAGDTFLAVLAYAYLKYNRRMQTAIILANRASSFVVQKTGTYSIRKSDVKKLRL